MRLDPYVNTHPRLLRKAALGEDPAAAPPEKQNREPNDAAKESPSAKAARGQATRAQIEKGTSVRSKSKGRPGDSRFVGATHLDEKQKLDIEKELKRRRIGDEMGRQIFVAAVEYQLSAFADQLQTSDETPRTEPPPPPRDRALEQILIAVEEQARLLSELLLQVPKPSMPQLARVLTAQDERGRNYDEGYLCELGGEIQRLRRACNAMTGIEEPPDTDPETDPDPETSGAFVRKLAGIFAECFEQDPTAAADGPFRTCLEVLDQMTPYVIGHDPDLLSRILRDR